MNKKTEKVAIYVESLFELYAKPKLCYHNLDHTRLVVKHASEMANFYHLNEEDRFVLLVAAWFHDIGHLIGANEGHEIRSTFIMEHFLCKLKINFKTIDRVRETIIATEANRKPRSLIEEIIKDSDVYHIGTSDFIEMDFLVWKEIENISTEPTFDRLERTLDFLKKHCFYTTYCNTKLHDGKNKNVVCIENKMKAL